MRDARIDAVFLSAFIRFCNTNRSSTILFNPCFGGPGEHGDERDVKIADLL